MMYDLVIVGAGPAGMTSAIYSARQKLKTLIISRTSVGRWLKKQ
jgi:thioredoxin reductase (NADPH)